MKSLEITTYTSLFKQINEHSKPGVMSGILSLTPIDQILCNTTLLSKCKDVLLSKIHNPKIQILIRQSNDNLLLFRCLYDNIFFLRINRRGIYIDAWSKCYIEDGNICIIIPVLDQGTDVVDFNFDTMIIDTKFPTENLKVVWYDNYEGVNYRNIDPWYKRFSESMI